MLVTGCDDGVETRLGANAAEAHNVGMIADFAAQPMSTLGAINGDKGHLLHDTRLALEVLQVLHVDALQLLHCHRRSSPLGFVHNSLRVNEV